MFTGEGIAMIWLARFAHSPLPKEVYDPEKTCRLTVPAGYPPVFV